MDGECWTMGRNNKEVGAMPTWNWLTFMCCQPCLPNFQCFQSFVSWTLLHSLLLRLSCHSLRNISFSGLILGLIKSAYHGWLSIMTSSEGPLFGLASGPPNPKPTTACMSVSLKMKCPRSTVGYAKDEYWLASDLPATIFLQKFSSARNLCRSEE